MCAPGQGPAAVGCGLVATMSRCAAAAGSGRQLATVTLAALLHLLVAVVFLRGFLLTRLELPDVAGCAPPHACSSGQPPAFAKAVLVIVDAVRHDFLCGGAGPGDSSGSEQQGTAAATSLMPKTLALVEASEGAAIAAKFVADTPTITMSRLKALLTGGLPTFLDVGQSFSASAVSEDNLLQQLTAAHKRLVMVGDDTWMQLAQGSFAEAYPFPSFNVHDLHTVDDGVWEHLLPLLERPDSWDVLIAHYLGVDHAGHTHGVHSRQMVDKLAQMDDQVSSVIESLVAQAGPGGRYADTLLLVLSDHGQTAGGDHGGGTPAETDSVLVAANLRAMHAVRQQERGGAGSDSAAGQACSSSGSHQAGRGGVDNQLLQRLMQLGGYTEQPGSSSSSGGHVCSSTIPQIDITPTLAHLLGVPTPFGNLGKLPPHLFAVLAAPRPATPADAVAGDGGSAAGGDAAAAAWLAEYAAALAANAAQVHAYLNRYAAVGGLPAAELATVNDMYAAVQQLQQRLRAPGSGSGGEDAAAAAPTPEAPPPDAATAAQLEALVAAQLSYLSAAAGVARRRFTLFQQGPMWLGCGLGLLLLGWQLWQLRRVLAGAGSHASWDAVTTWGFAGLAAFHALALFSVGLLMGEGRLQCVLLAAVTLLLLRSALVVVLQARSLATQQPQPASSSSSSWHSWLPAAQAVRAALGMLLCNVLLQLLGLIDRSGQDPHDKTQPTSELLVGPDQAWQRAAFVAFTVGPLVCIWLLLAAVGKLLQSEAAADAGEQQQQQHDSKDGPPASRPGSACRSVGSCAAVRVLQALCGVQFASLAVFWVAQLHGHSDDMPLGLLQPVWARLQHSALAAVLPALSAAVWAAGLQGLAGVGLSFWGSVLALPLRLLLPRLVYNGSLAALVVVVAARALPGPGPCPAAAASRLVAWLWLCGALAASLVMVLGYKGPATMLLALLQAVGMCRLLRLRAAAARACAVLRQSGGSGGSGSAGSHSSSVGGDGDGGVSVVAAGAWGMMGLQLFFCSGHFCEFSGLQYASAFIGFDSMVWYTSGSLLLLNTCGFLCLCCASLPVLLACCGAGGCGGGVGASTTSASLAARAGLLVVNSMRFAALVVSMVSAAVQQQHILLWAIFAPKLVFELWFMAVTDAAQLLTAAAVA